MYFILGRCDGNFRAAARECAETYPNRQSPDKNVFVRLDQRLRETGRLEPTTRDSGRPRTVRIPETEEEILQHLEENPRSSIRSIARVVGINHTLVFLVAKTERYHPYHYTRVQALQPNDFPRRMDYCRWLLNQIQQEPNFTRRILWTDESTFISEGIFNSHNSHYWATENPHLIRQTRNQHQFSVNVWAGIIDPYFLGPVILPHRVNHQDVLNFLNNDLQNLLDNLLPLRLLRDMWIQLDGAPIHHAGPVMAWLNINYPQRWIGRDGPTPWPPRLPDHNPLDFFLWGHFGATETLTEQMLDRVQGNIERRANACLTANGRQFEHLL